MKLFAQIPRHHDLHTITRGYCALISVLIILLTAYTYYRYYTMQPIVVTHAVPTQELKRSALYHCIKIFEKLPKTMLLATAHITQEQITITGKTQESHMQWVQKLAKEYSIVHTKKAQDGAYTLELMVKNPLMTNDY